MARAFEQAAISIRPDFTKFKPELQAGLAKATRNVFATVGVKVDTKSLRTQLKAIAEANSNKVAVKVGVNVDSTGLRAKLNALLREVGAGKDIAVGVKVDQRGLNAGLSGIRVLSDAQAKADREANLAARAREFEVTRIARVQRQAAQDAARATRQAEQDSARAARRAEQDAKRVVRAADNSGSSGISDIAKQFKAPTVIDFGGQGLRPMNALIAAGVALSPVLIAVASSATQASASVAALGAAGLGAIAGVAAVGLALTGVLGTFKAYQAAQKSARLQAANPPAAPKTDNGAAAAEQAKAQARAVRSAEEGLADAQRRSIAAQRDLTQARADARKELQGLKEDLSDLGLDERQARNDLARARQEQIRTNSDARTSDLDRSDAAIAVARAEDRLSDIRKDARTKQLELNKTNKDGIDSTDKVKAALEGVADAHRAVGKARESLADAKAQTKATVEQTAATAKLSGGFVEYQDQLAKLSPTARKLFEIIRDGVPEFEAFRRAVETATLPGFISFIKDFTRAGKDGVSGLDRVKQAVLSMGHVISVTTASAGKFFSSALFKRDAATITNNNAKAFTKFGQAGVVALRPLSRITAAASPLLVRLGDFVLDLAKKFDKFIGGLKKGELEGFFRRSGDEIAKFMRIGGNLLGILKGLFTASLPTGSDIVTRLGDFTEKIKKFVNSKAGQEQIRKFFEFFKKIDYGRLLKAIGGITSIAGAFKILNLAVGHGPMGLIFTFLGLLAARYPQQTADILARISQALIDGVGFVSKHPRGVAEVLAIIAAYKTLNVLRGLKLPKLTSPGGAAGAAGQLLGGAKLAEMTVTAGVVNVIGAVSGGGGGVVLPGTKGRPSEVERPGLGPMSGGRTKLTIVAAEAETAATALAAKPGVMARLLAAAGKVAPKALSLGSKVAVPSLLVASVLADPLVNKAFGKTKSGSTKDHVRGATSGAIQGALTGGALLAGTGPGAVVGAVGGAAIGAVAGSGNAGGIFNAIGHLPETVLALVKKIGPKILPFIVGLGKDIGNFFSRAFDTMLDFIKSLPGRILAFIKSIPEQIATTAGTIVGVLIVAVARGIPALIARWSELQGKIIGLVVGLAHGVASHFGEAIRYFQNVPIRILAMLRPLPHDVSNLLNDALHFFVTFPAQAVSFVSKLPGLISKAIAGIPGFFSAMWKKVTSTFDGAIQYAIHLMNTFLRAINKVTSPFDITLKLINEKVSANVQPTGNFAAASHRKDGGPIRGPGTWTSDSIPIMASNDEFVIKAQSARKLGAARLNALNEEGDVRAALHPGDLSSGVALKRARGGPISLSSFAHLGHLNLTAKETARVPGVSKFLREQAGKPYVWASAGPHGYDCSGLVSAAYNLIKARNPYSHTFSTSNEAGFFKSGVGPVFNVGWANPGERGGGSVGHTAGNIGGLGFESNGSDGVVIGKGGVAGGDFGFNIPGFTKTASAALKALRAKLPHNMIGDAAIAGMKGLPLQVARKLSGQGLDVAGKINPVLGGLVGLVKKFDSGGQLHPGLTLAYNGTGRTETVRTADQEAAGRRIDRRDLKALADMIANGPVRPIDMDGRLVSRGVARYSYVPMGV